MNLTELKSELEIAKKEAHKLHEEEQIKLYNKVELYFNTLFCNLPYHESLSINASKCEISVKINGWGLSDIWGAPIEFELRNWSLIGKENYDRIPLSKVKIARIDFDSSDLKNEELIKKYISFMSVVGSYTDTIFANRNDMEIKMADFSKQANFDKYYVASGKVWSLDRQIREEEDRIKAEEFAKISSMTEFVFIDKPFDKFYYAGEKWNYVRNVTRIKVIKKNKIKTWIELWYRYSTEVTLADGNYEYAPVDCKFNVEEIYTRYFDDFVGEYYQEYIKN